MKKVSVIVPAYNDAARLERALVRLRQVRQEEYPELELIASVRRSRDGTERVAAELADIVVEGGPVSAARNNGARAATGEVLVFLDADAVPGPGVISSVAAAASPAAIGTCTAYTEESSFPARATVALINFLRWSGLVKGLSNLLFCHRSLFRGLGIGYDERLSLGEHSDFVRRACDAGCSFVYVRTSPGYVIAMERHKAWGYGALMLFWLRWGWNCWLLRRDPSGLEREYWENRRPVLTGERQGTAA